MINNVQRGLYVDRLAYFPLRSLQDLMQDSSARLQAAKEDAEAKNAEIVAELDKFRRAFAGDPLGWSAATDEEGKPYYYNAETGEKNRFLLAQPLEVSLNVSL